ncbi:hypothetical protein F4679DRAFT_183854 [Xylaria curta]|nr:hypothetical protein F4679DRAFT_183854 [Xylaria curta]
MPDSHISPSSEDWLVAVNLQQLAYDHWKPLAWLCYPEDGVCWLPESSHNESKDNADDVPDASPQPHPPITRFEPCLAHMASRGSGIKGAVRYLFEVFLTILLVMGVIIPISIARHAFGKWDWGGICAAATDFFAFFLRINLFFTVLVVLCQLPLLAVNSPGCPRRCGSCICYAVYCLPFGPTCIRVRCAFNNLKQYHRATLIWRTQKGPGIYHPRLDKPFTQLLQRN